MWSPQKGPTRLWDLRTYVFILSLMINSVLGGNEIWPMERPDGMPTISSLEVMCGKDHMDVHLSFSQPFEGIVSSKGQHSDPRCIYVPPSTGKTFFAFRIAYARCGTKPDLNGQFYENTVVVQYDKDLLEVWDEAKRLRCEWFNDYEKTASKPPMVIADLDVIQLDFRGDNVDCWMEIQHGKGPWAPPVSGIVPLGSTLTLVVAINDYRGEFDMRVKSCVASDGGGHVIKLSDEYGCVLRPKMISRFLKARAPDEKATVITYAFFHAFKFPDALSVHIKCKVEICRHGCLDHCQVSGSNERKDTIEPDRHSIGGHDNIDLDVDHQMTDEDLTNEVDREEGSEDMFYDDVIHHNEDTPSMASINSKNMQRPTVKPDEQTKPPQQFDTHQHTPEVHEDTDDDVQPTKPLVHEMLRKTYMELKKAQDDKFPHGPRHLEAKDRMGLPPVAGPRSLNLGEETRPVYVHETADVNETGRIRRRRSVVVSNRNVRSADVGVSGIYDVISEADLAFSPDTKQEAVTVFQGKISEEIVYGICMPVPGFSILFIIIASAAVLSALIAGSLLYRYQLQKVVFEAHQQTAADVAAAQRQLNTNTLASWMSLRLFKMGNSNDNDDAVGNGSHCQHTSASHHK